MPAEKDPFREAREQTGVLKCPFQGENIPMILRHAELRKATMDWKTFSSDAPFRVPIPSEEEVRSMRQLPIELDPPRHTAYRKIVEPFFRRPKTPAYTLALSDLMDTAMTPLLSGKPVEAVYEVALPLQSRALTLLLNVPLREADEWIGWGLHVFRDGDGQSKGADLENYLNRRLDAAAANPGEDFFSALQEAEIEGRPLSREEQLGFANLTFAGGRDTVITSLTGTLAYFGEHPQSLQSLREDPRLIVGATEELLRYLSPLTHLGRVCPHGAEVGGESVAPDGRISLNYAAANYDAEVFAAPEEVRLERKPNPHVAFGFGPHNCLGAPHARAILRLFLEKLSTRVAAIEIIEAQQKLEKEVAYTRANGFDRLLLRLQTTTPNLP